MANVKCSSKEVDNTLGDTPSGVFPPLGGHSWSNPRAAEGTGHLESQKNTRRPICCDLYCEKTTGMRPNLHMRRKVSWPEDHHVDHSWCLLHQHPKRIILVKNQDRTVRRSIVLNRRTLCSFRAFMDEVSELMQGHVRQLCTLDGRKIDSIQSLMQSPNVLVCVGQEPFRPFLLDTIKKYTEESLPRLHVRSHSGLYSEGDFGFQAAKCTIHQRPDCNNKACKFMITSEKSPPPRQSYQSLGNYANESWNDDTVKRVRVNKDGSFSVEMKVRFHIPNDRTLHWSTEIKKSAAVTNGCVLDSDEAHLGSFSESESLSPYEAEDACVTDLHRRHLELPHCPHCCSHCQGYAIWKNSTQADHVQHLRSSSSSTSSHTFICRKSSVESMCTVSQSSAEFTEHVGKDSCFQQNMEDQDTNSEYHSLNDCCGQSGVSSISLKSEAASSTKQKSEGTYPQTLDRHETSPVIVKKSPKDQVSFKIKQVSEQEVHPLSSISNCSQFLKGDQDDNNELSTNREFVVNLCSDTNVEDEEIHKSSTRHSLSHRLANDCRKCTQSKSKRSKALTTIETDLADKSKQRINNQVSMRVNASDTLSLKSKNYKTTKKIIDEKDDIQKDTEGYILSAVSVKSDTSGRSSQSKVSEKPHNIKKTEHRNPNTKSLKYSSSTAIKNYKISEEHVNNTDDKEGRVQSTRSGLSDASITSGRSQMSIENAGEITVPSALSVKSDTSACSKQSRVSIDQNREETEDRMANVSSLKSDASTRLKRSKVSENHLVDENLEEETEDTAPSVLSVKSDTSTRCKQSNVSEMPPADENLEEETKVRVPSVLSVKSGASTRTMRSKVSEKAPDEERTKEREDRVPSVLSVMSNASTISGRSEVSDKRLDNERTDKKTEDRVPSVLLVKSDTSRRSMRCKVSDKPPHDDRSEETEDSVPSALSVKSDASVRSGESEALYAPAVETEEDVEKQTEERPPSSVPAKTRASKNSQELGQFAHGNTDITEAKPEKSMSTHSMKSKLSENHFAEIADGNEKQTGTKLSSAPSPSRMSNDSKKSFKPCSNEQLSRYSKSESENLHQDNVHNSLDEDTGSGNAYTKSMGFTKSKKQSREKYCASERTSTPSSLVSASIGLLEDQVAEDMNDKSDCVIVSSNASTQRKSEPKAEEDTGINHDRPTSAVSIKNEAFNHHHTCYEHANDERLPSPQTSTCSPQKKLTTNNSCSEVKGVKNTKHKNTVTCSSKRNIEVKERVIDEADKCLSTCSKDSSLHNKTKARAEVISSATTRPASSVLASEKRDRPKSNPKSISSLQVKGLKIKPEAKHNKDTVYSTQSNKNASTRGIKSDHSARSNTSEISVALCNCVNLSPTEGKPTKNVGTSNDGILSVSAAVPGEYDALEETHSDRDATESKGNHSSVCRHRKIKNSCSWLKTGEELPEFVLSDLPNASATDVVSEWLKNIPSDSCFNEMEDAIYDNCTYIKAQNDVISTVERCIQHKLQDVTQNDNYNIKVETQNTDGNRTNEKDKGINDSETPNAKNCPPSDASSYRNEAKTKNSHSSVQVMKALLSPKFDRCHSLREVSPVYGRKLSNSARELLDCLTNLQLIAMGPSHLIAKDAKYKKLMNIFQSLWLSDLPDHVDVQEMPKKNNLKDHRSVDDEVNPRSSSGVDNCSGSAVSGKSSIVGAMVQTKAIGPIISESITKGMDSVSKDVQEGNKLEERPSSFSASGADAWAGMSDPATPDIASRVQEILGSEATGNSDEEPTDGNDSISGKTIQSNASPKEIRETSSYKNFMRDSNILKLSDETEIDLQEETSSGTSSFVDRVQYSKISQDLDQWVLSLLNKIERQIMGHFVNTMAEFKVRWNLDDDELEIMVNELKDEVHRRIQASMDKELKKIKSRAGKTPRPPKEAMSRESTAQNKQRQRRLKIMQIKSIDMSLQKCDKDDTAAGTEFSDQYIEDQYCPCDICIKKKMIPKAVDMVNVMKSAPVKMDFDSRNILKMNPEYITEATEKNKRRDEMYVADFLNKKNTSVEAEVEKDEGNKYISEKLDVSDEDSMEIQMTEGHAIREDGGTCAEETTEKIESTAETSKDFKAREGVGAADKHQFGDVGGEVVQDREWSVETGEENKEDKVMESETENTEKIGAINGDGAVETDSAEDDNLAKNEKSTEEEIPQMSEMDDMSDEAAESKTGEDENSNSEILKYDDGGEDEGVANTVKNENTEEESETREDEENFEECDTTEAKIEITKNEAKMFGEAGYVEPAENSETDQGGKITEDETTEERECTEVHASGMEEEETDESKTAEAESSGDDEIVRTEQCECDERKDCRSGKDEKREEDAFEQFGDSEEHEEAESEKTDRNHDAQGYDLSLSAEVDETENGENTETVENETETDRDEETDLYENAETEDIVTEVDDGSEKHQQRYDTSQVAPTEDSEAHNSASESKQVTESEEEDGIQSEIETTSIDTRDKIAAIETQEEVRDREEARGKYLDAVEETDTETGNEGAEMGNQGDSAEAEDEAEDVSDAEQDAKSAGDTVIERQDADNDGVAMQETEEISFHVTRTRNMVYEDGEEADVEDSETEVCRIINQCMNDMDIK